MLIFIKKGKAVLACASNFQKGQILVQSNIDKYINKWSHLSGLFSEQTSVLSVRGSNSGWIKIKALICHHIHPITSGCPSCLFRFNLSFPSKQKIYHLSSSVKAKLSTLCVNVTLAITILCLFVKDKTAI